MGIMHLLQDNVIYRFFLRDNMIDTIHNVLMIDYEIEKAETAINDDRRGRKL